MDRLTYLTELTKALSGLGASDRENALAYYGEYLAEAEATAEGELDASAILGSPRTLAAQIKADIAMGDSEPTIAPAPLPSTGDENPVAPGTQSEPIGEAPPGMPAGAASSIPAGVPAGVPSQSTPKKSEMGVVWTVVLALLAIPVGVPLAIALIAVVFALFVTLGALLFSLAAVVVAFLVAAILCGLVGIYLLFADFVTGLFYLGTSLVTMGLCILFGMAFWQLGKLCIQGVAHLLNTIRKRLTQRERNPS
ncbi:MAG: hypothetical protein LBC23_04390 [Coriobacteriales bacterium]|jgi:uncharacterized membrane protein|nr:hypothetical protein [Coriobacteriales bacterium]